MLAKPDEEILAQAFDELKLFYPGFSPDWVEHSDLMRHDWGYALQKPSDWKRLIDFKVEATRHEGLSFANADHSLVALESGVITGKRAAEHAVASLSETV